MRFTSLAALLVVAGTLACDDSDPYDAARQACVDKINAWRAGLGLPAFQRWTATEGCADGEAASDGATGTAHGAFPRCGESAQNECPGWASIGSITDGCLDMMWAEGPGTPYSEHGHYINMTNPGYTMVACGFAVLSSGAVWAVQDFR
jgi:hypothetical protein